MTNITEPISGGELSRAFWCPPNGVDIESCGRLEIWFLCLEHNPIYRNTDCATEDDTEDFLTTFAWIGFANTSFWNKTAEQISLLNA